MTDQEFILQQQKHFYENLYESRDAHICDEHVKAFLMMNIHLFQY
jgi:hypothetical protein